MLSLARTYKNKTDFLFKKSFFSFEILFYTTFNRTLILFIILMFLILVNNV